jgi:chromate transport protein ChrA
VSAAAVGTVASVPVTTAAITILLVLLITGLLVAAVRRSLSHPRNRRRVDHSDEWF